MAKFQTEVRLSREMTLLDATLIGVGALARPDLLVEVDATMVLGAGG